MSKTTKKKNRTSQYKWIKHLYAEVDEVKQTLNMLTLVLETSLNDVAFVAPSRFPEESQEDWLKRCVKIINLCDRK